MAANKNSNRSTRKSSPSASKPRPAATEADRAAAEQAKHAPVGFGSGLSLDREKLADGLESVVKAKPEDRDAAISKALEDAKEGDHTSTNAPNAIPGHDLYRTTTELVPGGENGEGAVRVDELRQVYTGGDDDAGAGADVAAGGQPVVGGQSTIVDMEPVDADKIADAGPVVIPAKDGEDGASGTTTDVDAASGASAGQ